MHAKKATVEILNDRNEFEAGDLTTGVSMHCHTLRSKEMLDFIPHYAEQIPLVSWIYRREVKRFETKHGCRPDLSLGYWELPLNGAQLFDSERTNIGSLGLESIVSITDHDTIRENLELTRTLSPSIAPISMEWTVPYGGAYFHLGVHNLPRQSAKGLSESLLNYTFNPGGPDPERLRELFELLHEHPDLLVVFNHPFWDIEMIGQSEHDSALADFARTFGSYLHAIEVNGFRPWSENRLAMLLADEMDLPIISGGDRHCLSANTMINVSRCESFGEFVQEIRVDKQSHIVVFPEYGRPLLFRQIRTIADVLGHYPSFPESRQTWPQRVHFDYGNGNGVEALASRWNGRTPIGYTSAVRLIRLLGSESLLPLHRLLDRNTTNVCAETDHQSSNNFSLRPVEL